MHEILIGLVLFCFIVFMIQTEKENKNDLIKKNTINNTKNTNNNTEIDNNSNSNTDNLEKQIILTYSNTPNFRGFIDLYYPEVIKEEGGSKPFNNHIIDNSNLIANQVNYTNYESYRKKPYKLT